MTTAARPTWLPAVGGNSLRDTGRAALHQVSSRDLNHHTKLKRRQQGQNAPHEIDIEVLKARLQPKLTDAATDDAGEEKRALIEQISKLDADDHDDDDGPDSDGEQSRKSTDDDSDDDSDDEDDTADLLRELEKIKKERAEEKAREERLKAEEEQKVREESMLAGNPLLQLASEGGSSMGGNRDFSVKRRWDDDVIFKNQAKGQDERPKKRFINDVLRSDFHRKFMSKSFSDSECMLGNTLCHYELKSTSECYLKIRLDPAQCSTVNAAFYVLKAATQVQIYLKDFDTITMQKLTSAADRRKMFSESLEKLKAAISSKTWDVLSKLPMNNEALHVSYTCGRMTMLIDQCVRTLSEIDLQSPESLHFSQSFQRLRNECIAYVEETLSGSLSTPNPPAHLLLLVLETESAVTEFSFANKLPNVDIIIPKVADTDEKFKKASLNSDCNQVVAEKFFPLTRPDGTTDVYCEKDYFARLDLLCAKCGTALRGPHISALDRKYHLEHFTCSVCPTVFRQHDSYYERNGDVYCQYHYSVLFASKCGGCQTAVLKKFVEMSKDQVVQQWHPECYMVYKDQLVVQLWNVKVSFNHDIPSPMENSQGSEVEIERQKATLEKVGTILTVLSAFEESSAECIADMLIHFSNHQYQEGIYDAARFLGHVDAIFAGMDDIDHQALERSIPSYKTTSRREPRQLAKRIVHFFSLLSHAREPTARKETTKEMITIVTALANTLKSIIRTSLTSSIKLERKATETNAVLRFLTHLSSVGQQDDAYNRFSRAYNSENGTRSDLFFKGSEVVAYMDSHHTPEARFRAVPQTPVQYVGQPQYTSRDANTNDLYLTEQSVMDRIDVHRYALQELEVLFAGGILSPAQIQDLDSTPKQSVWSKVLGVINNKKPAKVKEGLFGVPLEVVLDRTGVESDILPGRKPILIPKFVDQCIRLLHGMDLSIEGIFRKNGNIRRLKEVADAFDANPETCEINEESPIQIAALLKKFLRELPEPLLTFKLYPAFIASQKLDMEKDRLQALHMICCLVPKPNFDLLMTLLEFLYFVSTYAVTENGGNRMDISNLATVIAPNILYLKSNDLISDESVLAVKAVEMLINHHKQLCLIPQNLLDSQQQ
ncbi:hypothetical protein HDV05_002229 [Chytridiales sp. JEL 0842]|nr:hypothetical protein HDV05_002229 [Chytridiales sp. JEL 0842]